MGRKSYIFEIVALMATIVQQNKYASFTPISYYAICATLIVLIVISVPEGLLYKKLKNK